MRLYFDEDSMRHAVAEALRRNGHDVLTAAEAGRLGYRDRDQMEFAVHEQRTVVTSNTGDYAALHREWLAGGKRHCGIIAINRQSLRIGEQIRALEAIAGRFSDEDLMDRFEYLTQWLRRD